MISEKFLILMAEDDEGHANLISALLTGIEFDELQRWAHQDSVKINAANRLK